MRAPWEFRGRRRRAAPLVGFCLRRRRGLTGDHLDDLGADVVGAFFHHVLDDPRAHRAAVGARIVQHMMEKGAENISPEIVALITGGAAAPKEGG